MSALGALLGFILLLFLIALIVRAVLDWTGLVTAGDNRWVSGAREVSHRVTEPVIGPVRRVLKPVRIGGVQLDLAFTVGFRRDPDPALARVAAVTPIRG
ncbi:YggT family protein [Pseudonocardia sp.]|uniref:YggT family protein n=1 Tax=Pseudonocardia sp. TaxID=60912 RepID=UPI00261BADDD|nr:YggT family protein [Pseudonocardia sp.]